MKIIFKILKKQKHNPWARICQMLQKISSDDQRFLVGEWFND